MAELCNDPLSDLNPELTFDINVEGTKKLLKMSNRCRKICLHVFV